MEGHARILIIGGGGLGAVAGYNLEQSGQATITFVLRSNYAVVSENGFNIDSCDHGQVVGWRPSGGVLNQVPRHDQPGHEYDFVICATKNIPDVPPSTLDIIRPAITPSRTVIVLIQNGLNIEKPFLEALPSNTCLSGVSYCSAEETSPGHIHHGAFDRLAIGPFPNTNIAEEPQVQAARDFVSLYEAAGKAAATLDTDVVHNRWKKLLYNAVYNPICAITDLDATRLRLCSVATPDPTLCMYRALVRPAMQEIRAAALAVAGVELRTGDIDGLAEPEPIEKFILPSMQQDMRKGRFLECEYLLGEAIREAGAVGVQMPIIRTLYCLCKAMQFRTRESMGMVDVDGMVRSYRGVLA